MARNIHHWTARYLIARIIEKSYRRKHPDVPWLAPAAVEFLDGYLKPSDNMLEFGSGHSTLWFAPRVNHITSIEHNVEWYTKISGVIKERSFTNVTYLLRPKQDLSIPASVTNYVRSVEGMNPESLNIILVDGTYRAQCVLQSLPKLKPGGVLIIDNVNRYLPSKSIAPNSRSISQGPIDEEWQQVIDSIGSWRFFWTSNGISDTAFYFKP